jgi:hypothetical protein
LRTTGAMAAAHDLGRAACDLRDEGHDSLCRSPLRGRGRRCRRLVVSQLGLQRGPDGVANLNPGPRSPTRLGAAVGASIDSDLSTPPRRGYGHRSTHLTTHPKGLKPSLQARSGWRCVVMTHPWRPPIGLKPIQAVSACVGAPSRSASSIEVAPEPHAGAGAPGAVGAGASF